MTLRVATRKDITFEAVRAVAWEGHSVEIAPEALSRMDRCHASFEAYVADRLRTDPGALIYGVTSAPGDAAATPLTGDHEALHPTRLWTAMSFGEPLPERVVRAIVLARLANYLDGHAGVRSATAQAVARMLEADRLPTVPSEGNGGAGEVLALGSLFYELSATQELTSRERMSLVNGSPCAAALVADVALAGRARLSLAEKVFALAVEAIGAPDEAYSPDLEVLWGDEHETAALRSFRSLLAGSTRERQRHQGPVSFRILPRVLGATRRVQAAAERAAAVSLRSVTDNPVYIPPDAGRPLGTVLTAGGYHNAQAPAAMDATSFAWADLAQLAQRHTDQLFQHPATKALLSGDEWPVKALHMVQNGWAEQARVLAQPTLLSLGAFGQNDVPAMGFLAWRQAVGVGRCLDAALATLAGLCSQALYAAGREPAPALRDLLAQVRTAFAPVTGVRLLGRDGEALSEAFASMVFADGGAVADA